MQRVILFCFSLGVVLGEPSVDGSIGRITGIVEQVLDTHIESFLGIPYAKPPLGRLRFALPEAFGPVGDFQATEYSAPCQQVADPTTPLGDKPPNEDCLYLNVFRKQGTSKNDKKAVVAIIHGGGYIVGGTAAPFENAAPLAGIGDVIIVSMNYRLGIFGFADMKEFAPGNLGLRDQRMVLQWIQDHISDFGGDPQKVTVMGVSAGSMSIAAQIITPIDDKNLFQSVVMDAGVVACNGFHEDSESSYTRLRKIAVLLGCPVDSSAMVDCLREARVEDLLPLAVNTTGTTEITSFVATIDGTFIPHNVEDYVDANSAKLRKIRTIIGYALDEGTFFMGRTFLTFDYPNPTTRKDTLEYCKKLSSWYDYRLDFSDGETEESILKLYVDEHTPYNAVAAFQSDGIFKCPINAFIRSYSEHNDQVYVYQFNRKLKSTYAKLFDPATLGAFHYSPYLHFSGAWFKNTAPVDPVDKEFGLEAMSLISSFARGENDLIFRGTAWPSFSKAGEVFIFDETPSLQKNQPSENRCRELFSSVLPTCDGRSTVVQCPAVTDRVLNQ